MFALLAIAYFVVGIVFAVIIDELKLDGEKHFFQASLMKKRSVWLNRVLWIFASGALMGLYYVIPLYLTKELGSRCRMRMCCSVFPALAGSLFRLS